MLRNPLPTRTIRLASFALTLTLAGVGVGQAPQHPKPDQHPGAGPPPQHPLRHARQEIATLEEQWKQATLKGDADAMQKLLAEDYVGISWTGQVNTKDMQLDRIRNRMVMVRHMDLTDIKVKIVGPVAIVTSRAEIDGTSDGKEITGAFRYTRVYQHNPDGSWVITNFEATRIPQDGEHMRERKDAPAGPPSS